MKNFVQTILVLIALFCFHSLYAQIIPSIEWQKSLGGSGTDIAYSIHQTADGGFIVGGASGSNNGDVTGNHGLSDCWIVRLDSNGNLMWQKSLGGSSEDIAYSIQQTADGGFIFAGISYSNDGDVSGHHGSFSNSDYWVVKLDSSGNLTWQNSLGGGDDDNAYSVQQIVDGGFIVAGFSGSFDGDVTGNHGGWDYWIAKLDSVGNLVWQKSLGGSGYDLAYSAQETIDGSFIVGGTTGSNNDDVSGNHGSYDDWIVKLDTSSNIMWQKTLGGSDHEEAKVEQTTDGGFIVGGFSYSNDGDVSGNHGVSDYWISKLDTAGNILWQKSLGGSAGEIGYFVQQSSDGGFILIGSSTSNDGDVSGNHGGNDGWLVKLDSGGNLIWQKSLGGSNTDYAYSVQSTTGGGFVSAGYSNSNDGDVSGNHGGADFWIVKLSCDQSQLFYADADSDGYGNIAVSILDCSAPPGFVTDSTDCDDNSPFIYPGAIEIPGNGIDEDCDGIIDIPTTIQNTDVLQSCSVFPNPASGNVFVNYSLSTPAEVSIEVYDILGNKLRQILNDAEAGEYHSTIDVQKLPDGIYFLKIQAGDQMSSQKIVLLR